MIAIQSLSLLKVAYKIVNEITLSSTLHNKGSRTDVQSLMFIKPGTSRSSTGFLFNN